MPEKEGQTADFRRQQSKIDFQSWAVEGAHLPLLFEGANLSIGDPHLLTAADVGHETLL